MCEIGGASRLAERLPDGPFCLGSSLAVRRLRATGELQSPEDKGR